MTFPFAAPQVPNWAIHHSGGPVLATAVHAGHELREELRGHLAVDGEALRREEDPLTDVWASVGDNVFCNYNSRFEVDLNRSREKALSTNKADTWGLEVWASRPDDAAIERSLRQHDAFYAMMRQWLEALIEQNGKVLLLDLHSYCHRRDGPYAEPAPQADNPDIDLGLTTADRSRFGNVIDALVDGLAAEPCQGRAIDVRANVRYPDGGYWPEWVAEHYGADVCTITLEYKKFYMDEHTGVAYLPVVMSLRAGLQRALNAARAELVSLR